MWGSRTALAVTLAAVTGLGPGVPAAAAKSPSAARIRRAVRAAERSKHLWATVNTCDTRAHPHMIGVRGQMPALGFAADLRMTFEIDYFSVARHAYEPLPKVADVIDLGTASRGNYQDGVGFTFGAHAGRFRGRVVFTWRLGRRTIGSITKLTAAGHTDARFGNPSGYSRASCVIR